MTHQPRLIEDWADRINGVHQCGEIFGLGHHWLRFLRSIHFQYHLALRFGVEMTTYLFLLFFVNLGKLFGRLGN